MRCALVCFRPSSLQRRERLNNWLTCAQGKQYPHHIVAADSNLHHAIYPKLHKVRVLTPPPYAEAKAHRAEK